MLDKGPYTPCSFSGSVFEIREHSTASTATVHARDGFYCTFYATSPFRGSFIENIISGVGSVDIKREILFFIENRVTLV